MQPINLLDAPAGTGEEFFPILAGRAFRLESIVSRGQASPPDFWYDQEETEWVVLLAGEAVLEFGDREAVGLKAGDSLVIPARCRHRVASVSMDAVWLGLHYAGGEDHGR